MHSYKYLTCECDVYLYPTMQCTQLKVETLELVNGV